MAALKIFSFAKRFRPGRRALLAGPLAERSDREIDQALEGAGLSRAQLFGAAHAGAKHRVLMAHMMAVLKIDAAHAVRHHWQSLKQADEVCARCGQADRCRRWLAWGRLNDAQRMFCPNAPLFTRIGRDPHSADRSGEHLPPSL